MPASFSAKFDGECFPQCFFGLVFFPGLQASPTKSRPNFTLRFVGIPLDFHFLEPKVISRRFSAYWEIKEFAVRKSIVLAIFAG